MESSYQKFEEDKVVDPTLYKSLVESLRYLICVRMYILYEARLLSYFMEEPKFTHWKAAKKILCYIRGAVSHGLIYSLYDF